MRIALASLLVLTAAPAFAADYPDYYDREGYAPPPPPRVERSYSEERPYYRPEIVEERVIVRRPPPPPVYVRRVYVDDLPPPPPRRYFAPRRYDGYGYGWRANYRPHWDHDRW